MNENVFDHKHIEAFRLWFKYFQESDIDARAPNVAEQFGNVAGVEFEDWWPTHRHLFADIEPFDIEVLDSTADFEWFDDDPDIVRVAISLLESKTDLKAAFDKLLLEHHSGKDGAKPFEHLGEVYSLCARPDVPNLESTLKVWRYCKANPDLEPHEVEEKLGLLTKRGPRMHAYWNQGDSGDAKKQQQRMQRDEVKYHLRRAEALIKNVARGNFPILK